MQNYPSTTPVDGDEDEPENVLLMDATGSQLFPLYPGSSQNRWSMLVPAVGAFQQTLFESDAEAQKAVREGRPESELGGLRAFTISDKYPADLGDVNPMNYETKISKITPNGHTYLMHTIRAWEAADAQEIKELGLTQEVVAKRHYNILCAMDGAIDDWDRNFGAGTFKDYVERESANKHFFFLLIGRGSDNVNALAHYADLQRLHPDRITVLDTQHITDYQELADEMLQAIS